jgi:hypothetical protein
VNNLDYYCESSAKTGFNTAEMFIEAAKLLYADYKKNESTHSNSNYISISDKSANSFKLKNGENEAKEVEIKKSSCFCWKLFIL